jgi:outer membrane protein assembly factor BamD
MPKILSRNCIAIATLAFSIGFASYCTSGQTNPAQTGSSQPAPPQKKANSQPTDDKAKTSLKLPAKGKAVSAKESSVEPDKVLYDRAVTDIAKGHYIEGRLSYQTLINTYPDSEYLAKAKLGVADSYFKEGGTSNITQAVQEYKDFITFFPFLDESAYAQMQVAMAHYRMMEKTDRDRTQAENAEDEFQTFLLKYPQSPLVPKAEQNLRDVQEVLADSQFRVARFYYLKMNYAASAARLIDLSQRYPLYSQSDEALWMLGDVYQRAKQVSKNEDDKNHWADLSAECYRQIIKDYPLSRWSAGAKSQLKAMGMPVPASDPNAEAEMRKEQIYQKEHHQLAMVRLPRAMMRSAPDISAAARSGQPNLSAPDDAISATEILKPGASGPSFNLAMRPATDPSGGAPEQGAPVEAVSAPAESSSAPGMSVGAAIIESPGQPATAQTSTPSSASAPPETSSAPTITLEPVQPAQAADAVTTSSSAATPETSEVPAGGTIAAVPQSEPDKADSKTESTSKKKKGIRKVIPF